MAMSCSGPHTPRKEDEPDGVGDETPSRRVELLTTDEAAQVVGAFEVPTTELQRAADDGLFDPLDEEFVRNTLHQIILWRRREEASPQIFELLVADLVRRVLAPYNDTHALQEELSSFGADEDTAAMVAEHVLEATEFMTQLGGEDPHHDSDVLEEIDARLAQIAASVENLKPQRKSGWPRPPAGEEGLVAVSASTR